MKTIIGVGVGLVLPAVAHPAEGAISPVLGLLLYATFLGVPFSKIGHAFGDWRFLTTVLVVNVVLVPVVVFLLSRIVAHEQVLLVGVLFVLLTPCVDYVIVFTGIAGGAKDRLLAAPPLLMLAQMLLLPVYLWLFVGAEFVQAAISSWCRSVQRSFRRVSRLGSASLRQHAQPHTTRSIDSRAHARSRRHSEPRSSALGRPAAGRRICQDCNSAHPHSSRRRRWGRVHSGYHEPGSEETSKRLSSHDAIRHGRHG